MPDSVKTQVQTLIKEKYFDVNLQHLSELLAKNENINIKRETLRRWAHEIQHVKRAKRRRPVARKRRERMESPGLLIQMDGSPHLWFGDKKSCLIAMIDDANSEIHAEFFPSETTLGCLKIMLDFIAKNGLFKTLYVDRAGIFAGPKRCNFSQMQRACHELGIEIIFANSPQGKGRIERAFDTFQDRLAPELRLQNISDMTNANRYLQEIFIPDFWKNNTEVIPKNFHAHCANQQLVIAEVIEPSKPGQFDPEIQKKMDAIELAEQLNSVTEAARISGCSRETIYKNCRLLKEKGPLALKRTFRNDTYHQNRASPDLEKTVIEFSLANPHLGQAQVAIHFKEKYQLDISAGGVRGICLKDRLRLFSALVISLHFRS